MIDDEDLIAEMHAAYNRGDNLEGDAIASELGVTALHCGIYK